jgi:uncharacterized protein YbaR (Trm112 family)
MRQIQTVSKYIALSQEDLVPRLVCPMDQGPLFVNQNLEDQVFLYCLSCEYKKFIGYEFYDDIINKMKGL